MKAISLWQPWASLWCSPRKIHETRHWDCAHRGWLVVHAAKRFEKDHPPALAAILRAEFGADWFKTLPTGAIIGMVNLINCAPTERIIADTNIVHGAGPVFGDKSDNILCGDFAPGRFGWERSEFKLLPSPVPYRGMQGFFNVPDELLAEAIAA